MGQMLMLSFEHELRHELRLELRLIQEFEDNALCLLEQTDVSPKKFFDNVIVLISSKIKNEKLKEAVEYFLKENSEDIIASSINYRNKNEVLMFVLESIHKSHPDGLPDPDSHELLKISLRILKKVFSDSDVEFRKDLAVSEDMAKEMKKNKTNGDILINVRERHNALRIKKLYEQEISTMCQLLNVAAGVTDNDYGGYVLESFTRDLKTLKTIIASPFSEKILRRFYNRFKEIRKNQGLSRYTSAMLNTIAEITLISLGIIDSRIFSRKAFKLDDDYYTSLSESFSGKGLNLDQTMNYYNLKRGGTLFWHRWSTNHIRPSGDTDEAVREFITKVVRQDGPEILEALCFHELFKELKIKKFDEQESDEDLFNSMSKILIKHIKEESFKTCLISLIQKKWLNQLKKFL